MLVNLDELYTKTWFDQSRSNDPVEFTKISWREIPLLTDECVMKCIRWWSPENHTLTLLCDFILYPSAGNCGYIQIPPSGTINQSAFPPTFMLCVFFKYFGGFLINLDGGLYGWYYGWYPLHSWVERFGLFCLLSAYMLHWYVHEIDSSWQARGSAEQGFSPRESWTDTDPFSALRVEGSWTRKLTVFLLLPRRHFFQDLYEKWYCSSIVYCKPRLNHQL